MQRFFKENWLWIAAPIVVIGLLVLGAMLFLGDGAAPFEYVLF